MTLGEKIRQARIQAGLSQRQLCGDVITRNMLSQIENGSANPSMSTLQFLSTQLKLPVSYFLEEDGTASVNGDCVTAAWRHFESGEPAAALRTLENYRSPDPVFDREVSILRAFALLNAADVAIASGKQEYGRQLLIQAQQQESELPWLPELRTRRALLACRLGARLESDDIPHLDEILLLRAEAAVESGAPARAIQFLDAADHQQITRWCFLRGRAAMAQEQYSDAAAYLSHAEAEEPAAIPLLEICYRELGDFRQAYAYACKRRG